MPLSTSVASNPLRTDTPASRCNLSNLLNLCGIVMIEPFWEYALDSNAAQRKMFRLQRQLGAVLHDLVAQQLH